MLDDDPMSPQDWQYIRRWLEPRARAPEDLKADEFEADGDTLLDDEIDDLHAHWRELGGEA